ncbi:MAG TPA: LysE family translocator [Tepidisphaeraceae bacterium]|nr:LysE family translocator [Tepidisphaeraceae bacterium]
MSLWMLWKGIILGLGAAAPIGPVNVEIARRSLRGGFFAGFLVGCGAVSIDTIYVIFAALSISPFLHHPAVEFTVALAGAGLLAYLGITSLLAAARLWQTDLPITAAATPPQRNYLTGLLMTATNPMTLAFWFVVIPTIGPISSKPWRDLPLVCAGVALGAISWVCFFATLTGLAGRIAKRTTMLLADVLGGLTLLGFAASTLVALYAKYRAYL